MSVCSTVVFSLVFRKMRTWHDDEAPAKRAARWDGMGDDLARTARRRCGLVTAWTIGTPAYPSACNGGVALRVAVVAAPGGLVAGA